MVGLTSETRSRCTGCSNKGYGKAELLLTRKSPDRLNGPPQFALLSQEPLSVKICLVSQEYPPETARGGIGTQTYFKAHGFAARGHEVYVLSRNPEKGISE